MRHTYRCQLVCILSNILGIFAVNSTLQLEQQMAFPLSVESCNRAFIIILYRALEGLNQQGLVKNNERLNSV